VDVQSGTFDDPGILPPTESIQVTEAPAWMVAIPAAAPAMAAGKR